MGRALAAVAWRALAPAATLALLATLALALPAPTLQPPGAIPMLDRSPPVAEAAGRPAFQRSATSVRPAPRHARKDKGKVYDDGCFVDQKEMRWPRCVYGKRSSKRTVVLFGDSEAMQWFDGLHAVARRNGWRLIARGRAGCPPMAIHFAHRCDKWRKRTLRLIERDRPGLVVISSGTKYRAIRNGRRLGPKATRPVIRRGYIRTLRRLRRAGARVAVIKDTPRAPHHVPSCVSKSLQRLRKCAFYKKLNKPPIYDARAARRVKGARLVKPVKALCRRKLCPAVIDDMLVYRDANHLTATYARALAPWLDRRLPRPKRR